MVQSTNYGCREGLHGHGNALRQQNVQHSDTLPPEHQLTMRFGSTAEVLLKCKLKYYRISECNLDTGIIACSLEQFEKQMEQ